LKDSFRKELNLQRNTKSGQGKRKKKYLFFDQLLFLLLTLQERQTGGNYASPQAYSTVVAEDEEYTDVRITESQNGGPGDSNFTFPTPTNERRKERKRRRILRTKNLFFRFLRTIRETKSMKIGPS
jgi:hypothetical protein